MRYIRVGQLADFPPIFIAALNLCGAINAAVHTHTHTHCRSWQPTVKAVIKSLSSNIGCCMCLWFLDTLAKLSFQPSNMNYSYRPFWRWRWVALCGCHRLQLLTKRLHACCTAFSQQQHIHDALCIYEHIINYTNFALRVNCKCWFRCASEVEIMQIEKRLSSRYSNIIIYNIMQYTILYGQQPLFAHLKPTTKKVDGTMVERMHLLLLLLLLPAPVEKVSLQRGCCVRARLPATGEHTFGQPLRAIAMPNLNNITSSWPLYATHFFSRIRQARKTF